MCVDFLHDTDDARWRIIALLLERKRWKKINMMNGLSSVGLYYEFSHILLSFLRPLARHHYEVVQREKRESTNIL